MVGRVDLAFYQVRDLEEQHLFRVTFRPLCLTFFYKAAVAILYNMLN